jgi:hypothetical protein
MLIKYGPSYKQLEENTNRTLFYAEIVITINIQYRWVYKAHETMMIDTSGTEHAYLSGSTGFILDI